MLDDYPFSQINRATKRELGGGWKQKEVGVGQNLKKERRQYSWGLQKIGGHERFANYGINITKYL